jgi:CHAT domain-containing protein
MRWLALLLILFGCSVKPKQGLDTLYHQARDHLQTGDLQKALDETASGISAATNQHDPKQQWRFRLLRCEVLAMKHQARDMLAILAEPMPSDPGLAESAARKTMLEAQALAILDRPEEAEPLLEQAHRAAEAANASELLAQIEILQGPIIDDLHGASIGERILRGALEKARATQSRYLEANILINLAYVRSRKMRWEEAANLYEQALAVADPRWQLMYPVAQNNLAICYEKMGETDRAIAIQKQAIDLHARSGAKTYQLGALRSTGESYLNKGELREAIPYLERALRLADEIGSVREGAWAASNLSSVYIELGEWDKAEELNQTAIRLKQAAKLKTIYYNLRNEADIAAGKGDLQRAEKLYKQVVEDAKPDPSIVWDAHNGLGMVAWRRRNIATALREYEAAVDLVERTRAEIERTEFKLPFLTSGIKMYRSYAELLLERGQTERALAVADSSRAQVLTQRSGSAPMRRPAPGAYVDLAQRTGSVLLSYWLGPAKSHVWVVTSRGIHHAHLPGAAEIEPLVVQYQGAIERQLADPMRTRLAAGEKLYEILVAPVRRYLPAGTHVVLLPDGALHSLNFETLPVPGEASRYLIEDLTFEIAPSLGAAAATPAQPLGSGLLLLGDPVFNDPLLPPLAGAPREIACIRQHFSSTKQNVLTGEGASPQAFLDAAQSPLAAIHFTAHAVANRESPLESTVLLSKGKLYARDVMDLSLKVNLVTISACRCAGQRIYSGEGLVGFAWAFLRAGARNVIAGLWDVNDQSTAGFMDTLYRELAAGKRPADALRTAKLAMIQSPGNLKKPYYWAPFQLYTVAP